MRDSVLDLVATRLAEADEIVCSPLLALHVANGLTFAGLTFDQMKTTSPLEVTQYLLPSAPRSWTGPPLSATACNACAASSE